MFQFDGYKLKLRQIHIGSHLETKTYKILPYYNYNHHEGWNTNPLYCNYLIV